jgi:catechol 2,3-dioxygenase-like lactoylglutathione lyase family enzyme
MIIAIDHVQLAMPKGEEAKARAFYEGILGMKEIAKPELLAKRGGAWFESGKVQIHLGVEDDFRPAKKAHVAIVVERNFGLRKILTDASFPVKDDDMIPGVKRFYTDDTFGNRIEIIEIEGSPK